MSRSYQLDINVKKDSAWTDREIGLVEGALMLHWPIKKVYPMSTDNTRMFCGDGYLNGGEGEDEATDRITSAIARVLAGAKLDIVCRWTYMDDLPFEDIRRCFVDGERVECEDEECHDERF